MFKSRSGQHDIYRVPLIYYGAFGPIAGHWKCLGIFHHWHYHDRTLFADEFVTSFWGLFTVSYQKPKHAGCDIIGKTWRFSFLSIKICWPFVGAKRYF